MVQVWSRFLQPSNIGEQVGVQMIGEPAINPTETIRFVRFGQYEVVSVANPTSLIKQYTLRLTEKYSFQSTVNIGEGTIALTENEGVTISDLPYSPVIYLNFKEADYRNLLLSGNIIFAAQYHFPGKSITVRIRNLSGTLSRTVAFPPSWIFLGNPGRPSSIAPSRTAILSITSFAASDADVIAAWAVQA